MTLLWMAAKILLRPVAEWRPHAGGAPSSRGEGRRPKAETITMTKLSDTQRVILSAAAQHEIGLTCAPMADATNQG